MRQAARCVVDRSNECERRARADELKSPLDELNNHGEMLSAAEGEDELRRRPTTQRILEALGKRAE
jgi:hypothetical protein